MAHSTRLCFLEIVSLCLTLASLFGRHHSAAQGGGSSWSGLQLHQRGGIPRPGGEWTAAGERHIRWYVSTQHSFTTLEAEKKKNRMENIMCWCELLAPRSPVFHLGLHIEWAAFVKRFSRLNNHPRCRTTQESAFGQAIHWWKRLFGSSVFCPRSFRRAHCRGTGSDWPSDWWTWSLNVNTEVCHQTCDSALNLRQRWCTDQSKNHFGVRAKTHVGSSSNP